MYESKHQPLLTPAHFARRLVRHIGLVTGLLAGSLGVGMAGYRYFEGLPWLDSFLNASMLLGGMGPLEVPQTPGGKFFAGCYALYAGLFFLITAAIVFAPVLHRILHKFHWNEKP
jgi:hypothetical protein